ncbi:MAG: DNA-3-methyladenine glycosylase [Actinomycetota bacterium]|nr:DNA-3-methyladenine glycosylase [Actinomycetota bacterium]
MPDAAPAARATTGDDSSTGDGTGLRIGPDGLARCAWADTTDDYRVYHDDEWGRPVHGERVLYERVTLESFQSGLSWLTILRKREGFRAAFAGFDPQVVARFGEDDVARLLADVRIVRNRAKVRAAITNAQAVLDLRRQGGLEALMWSFAPPAGRHRPPRTLADVPTATSESAALSKTLKEHRFVFVGPTTAYAAMQACGLVNDHLVGCQVRGTA